MLSGLGGRRAQLNRLRAGRHPVTCIRLPEATLLNGDPLQGSGKYSRLWGEPVDGIDLSFRQYVPVELPRAMPVGGTSAAQKMRIGQETIQGGHGVYSEKAISQSEQGR